MRSEEEAGLGVQEELRRLDDELSAGRLDADAYRRHRDELLAARPPEPAASRPVSAHGDRPRQAPAGPPAAGVDAGPARPEETGSPGSAAGAASSETDDLDERELDEAERGLELAPEFAPEPSAAPSPSPAVPSGSPAAPSPGAASRGPFPPPFRWGRTDESMDGETEDGLGGASGGRSGAELAERTGNGAGRGEATGSPADATQIVPGADRTPERTQVVPGDRAVPDPPVGAGSAGPSGVVGPAAGRAEERGDPAERTQVVGRSHIAALDPGRPRAGGAGPAGRGRHGPSERPGSPPSDRTQYVPGGLARAGHGRSVPARQTAPPWVTGTVASRDGRAQGRELFVRDAGPSPATIAGTVVVVLLVVAVLVLSFLLV